MTDSVALWVASEMERRRPTFYERWGKRPLDLAIAVPAALLTAPVVTLAAVLIKLESPGSALFRQVRVGRSLSEFTVFKLRTMREGNTAKGQVLAGDPDTTKVGEVLRRWKIDELPQLYNVVLGSMSLVGPRPLLPTTVDEVDENGRHRFLVRPGLTGLAQTNGNVSLSWPQRWRYDRLYVEGVTFGRDVVILIKTVAVIVTGEHGWVKA